MLFMILSVCIVIPLNVSGMKTSQPLLYAALFTFGTYALSEELAKFYMFRRRLKILDGEHSWLDLIVYATIVGIGFGILESIVFVATSGPFDMLLRGITIPHGGFGAIVGYFYGKSVQKNKKEYAVFGVFLAFLIHGLYDFSLRDELQAVSLDLAAAIAFPVVLLDVILIIVLIVSRRKDFRRGINSTRRTCDARGLRQRGLLQIIAQRTLGIAFFWAISNCISEERQAFAMAGFAITVFLTIMVI